MGEMDKATQSMEFVMDIPLQVTVELGRAKMLLKDFLQLQQGSIVELNKLAGEPLDVFVNSRLVGRGEAVCTNDKLGVRLMDLVSASERVGKSE